MKSRNFKFALMAGFVGLASFVVTSCTDNETVKETQKVEDGISFAVSDIQNINEASLPKTKAPSVYATTSTPLSGNAGEGLDLVETTIEGVDPVYQPATTRGTVITKENFGTINKPFAIFACKNGSSTANFLYNEKVKADGTMENPVKWKKSDATSLKFYAVHPAVTDANQKITTTSGTNPIIEFAPNEDVKKQTDLLVATTSDYAYDQCANKAIPIEFSHITTAVQFKIGNDLSYNQKVKTIEIKGVIGQGTYDIASKTWTLSNTKKNYTLTLNQAFSTADLPGTIINGNDGVFFMIPQTIPDDATVKITFESGKFLTAKIGGNGKKWVGGTTRTYAISNSSDTSDRDFTLTVTPDVTTKEYNDLDVSFKVQSYSHLKDYPNAERDKSEPWEVVGYEYREGNGDWTPISTTKPSMLASITTNGTGSTTPMVCSAKLTNDYQDFVAYRNKQLKEATPVTKKDLSMIDGKQYTANCYIVSAPGTYRFPLYYGSSRVNSEDVEASFRPYVTGNALPCFIGGVDQGGHYVIPYPDIHQWIDVATVLWQSKENLINVTSTDRGGAVPGSLGGRNKYVEFTVDKNNIEMGNAIIAVWKDNKIIWTWHIWVTGKDVVDVPSGQFMREPIGFIPKEWKRTSYSENRQVKVTIKQTRSGKTASTIITQKPHFDQAKGQAMYYQWGRKDPFWLGMTGLTSSAHGGGGISLHESIQNPKQMGNLRMSGVISSSGEVKFWGDYFNWNNNTDRSYTYYNLWDAKNTTGYGYTGQFVKTIYDPSPAQFHVPRAADFSKFTNDRKFSMFMGDLNPEGGSDKATPTHENETFGYYWTSEKVRAKRGNDESYFAVHAYATNDNDLTIQKDGQYFTNPSIGYNVLPIKE